MRRIAVTALAGLALVGFAACSPDEGDFASEAEDFIGDDDGDVATTLGVTFEDIECQDPANTDVGMTFTCTATGSDGQTYTFTNEVSGDKEFKVIDAAPSGGATGGSTPAGTTPAVAPTTSG
jgi:hypothetical protein